MKSSSPLAAHISGLQAFLWALVAAILEAVLLRRSALGWAMVLAPLALGSVAAFLMGRLLGLALTGVL
jgi:hypothetical protein